MTNCKYKLRKLSVGLVSVGTMLIAPTVLGQEVSTTGSTETSAASTTTNTASADATASGTAATTPSASTSTGGAAGSEAAVASSGGTQSATATSETTPQPQALVSTAATSASSTSSSDEKSTKSATTSTSPSTPVAASSSSNGNQETSAETAPQQMMDVEQYKIKDENSSITVADKDKQLKIRRDIDNPKDKDLFDVKREVKDNGDGTLDVTLKVTPKQIDEGADVMALLDVSKKMTEDDFNNAKEKIKKLVKTLTSKPTDSHPNHNARNSVRLMTFYREISDPIDISGKTDDDLDKLLDELREKAKANYDWGVDLQGAIHNAREIFRKEKESKKRQHIVLFSQGEATFSYDIQKSEKEKSSNLSQIRGEITSSNPLLPWPPIFDHTNKSADMLEDVSALVSLAKKLGIESLNSLESILKTTALASDIGGFFTGQGSLTEYLSLHEYKTDDFNKEKFDYGKRVGEGYYHYSFSKRKSYSDAPLKFALEQALKQLFPESEKESWLDSILKPFSLGSYQEVKKKALMMLIDYMFYRREYHYYNHNLSAIAEAKMAQKEGITFYSVDVTDSKTTSKRVRRQTVVRQKNAKKESEEERNSKFDAYLKKMSEGNTFLDSVEEKDKFKDTFTNVTVTETFEDKVSAIANSWESSLDSHNNKSDKNNKGSVKYAQASNAWFTKTKESLTWTISKDQLKQAFEEGKPITLTYKLKVEKEKFKAALKKQQEDNNRNRKKRAVSSESENTVTETIVSNKISYKINNGKDINNNKLEDVKMSYSKFKMPIPELDIEVVPIPEKPLVEPMTPLYPAIPNYPTPQLPKDEDLEISGGHGPIVDIVEDTGTGVEGGAQNGVVSTQENKDPIVDITEDTQPGMSGSNDATVVEEDTAPKRPDVLVGGQSDPIDITEDTQPSVSGSNDATVVEEDTAPKRPDILVGGQSDPIDITEDTQPGMSGSNDATVIEEDTKPKRFFHFDNEPQAPEKPKEQPSLSLPQAPVYKAAHHLPASGDKREASFTIVALTIIGAAGLLSKKRRDTEEN
ncbi:TPA: serum opacification factor [Streptococcus pyogenes]